MDDDEKSEFGRLLQAFHAAKERDDLGQAESIGVQILAFAAEDAERNPSESLRLILEAHEHEDAARWEQAEAAHRQVVALAEAEGNEGMVFKAHHDLSKFYLIRGMVDKALQESQTALAAARKADFIALRLVALQGTFQCHLMKEDTSSAAAIAEEAVQITSAETDKMHDGLRARALLMRARSRLEQGQISQAEQDLEVAWRILAPEAKAKMFAGVQGSLADCWEVTAQIRTRSRDLAGAAQAMGKAVEFRRTVSQLPQLSGPYKRHALAKTLREYSVALLAAGEAEAATQAFDESREIQQKIGTVLPLPGTPKS